MTDGQDISRGPQMHPASVLVREVLVLNEEMEFIMRRDMDMNETDFQAMQHLMKMMSISPGEMAQLLHLTPAATTTVIDRLVAKGHAKRNPHPTDRRRWVISPSPESVQAAMKNLMPMIIEVDNKARSYDESGQQVIVDFLGSVVESMKRRIAAMEAKTAEPVKKQNHAIAKGVQ